MKIERGNESDKKSANVKGNVNVRENVSEKKNVKGNVEKKRDLLSIVRKVVHELENDLHLLKGDIEFSTLLIQGVY